MLQHLNAAREAYAAGRAARGLPVAPERLAEIFTPGKLWVVAFGITAFYLLLTLFALRRRGYVVPDGDESPGLVSGM